MTLIAVATTADTLTLMTDTRSADVLLRHSNHDTKMLPLLQIDSVLAYQGQALFGRSAAESLMFGAAHLPDLDGLLGVAPRMLKALWEDIATLAETPIPDSMLIVGGYSPRAERFTACYLASIHDFEPVPIEGLFVQPAPTAADMSELEHARLRKHFDLFGLRHDAPYRSGQPTPVPENEEQWQNLAIRIRQTRAMAPIESGLKWVIGGSVFLTTLTRGALTARRIHTFDDSGAEYAAMLAGTLHPIGQAGPCPCGSGQRLIDCCASHLNDESCPCGFGDTFATCCSIDAGQPAYPTEGQGNAAASTAALSVLSGTLT